MFLKQVKRPAALQRWA